MLKLPGYFTGFRSKSDGSASLTFGTQELTPDDFAEMKRVHNAFGWLVFKPNDAIEDAEIPKEQPQEEGKSATQRLYAVMFVYWKQKVNEGDFDSWRKQKIERIIDQYKEKLD